MKKRKILVLGTMFLLLTFLAGCDSTPGIGVEVTKGTVKGTITADGIPVQDATVSVLGTTVSNDMKDKTDENGKFEIHGVPQGQYFESIQVSKDGYDTVFASATVEPNKVATVNIDLIKDRIPYKKYSFESYTFKYMSDGKTLIEDALNDAVTAGTIPEDKTFYLRGTFTDWDYHNAIIIPYDSTNKQYKINVQIPLNSAPSWTGDPNRHAVRGGTIGTNDAWAGVEPKCDEEGDTLDSGGNNLMRTIPSVGKVAATFKVNIGEDTYDDNEPLKHGDTVVIRGDMNGWGGDIGRIQLDEYETGKWGAIIYLPKGTYNYKLVKETSNGDVIWAKGDPRTIIVE